MRNKSGGLKFSAVNYPDLETKRGKLLKIDGSKMNFPFGARPIFRGELAVSFREGSWWLVSAQLEKYESKNCYSSHK